MKKKILSLLLVLCMLVSSFAMLVACQKEEEKPKTPAGGKEEKVAALLTADSAKNLIADLRDTVVETAQKEIDYKALIEDINLYAEVEEETFSIKDGYIVVEDPYYAGDEKLIDRFVIGIKDAMLVGVENGVATGHESLETPLPTEELDAMIEEVNAAIDMVVAQGLFLEITKNDIEFKDGWYCIKESYIANAIMNVVEKMMAAEMPEGEVAPEMEEQMNDMKAQMQTMIDAALAQADIIIGFAMDGDKLNGLKIAVKADDLDSIVSMISPDDAGMMTGSIEMSIEAKLTADLSTFSYIDISADMDATQNGVEMVEKLGFRAEYANNTFKITADIDMQVEENVFDIAAEISLAHDAEGVPTLLKIKADAVLEGIEVSEAPGVYQVGGMPVTNIYAEGVGDLTVSAEAVIDFTKLAGSGEAVKANLTMSTANVVVGAYAEYIPDGVEITEEMMLASLSEGQMAELRTPESLNGTMSASLVTEGGEGTLSATMTDKNGDTQSVSVEVAVNSGKALVPTQAEKDAIANYVPAVEEK